MSLENGNRLCLGTFLGAEYDDLPERVRQQVRLVDAGLTDEKGSEVRGRSIFAAVAGAQLLARSRCDISLDAMIDSYKEADLLQG